MHERCTKNEWAVGIGLKATLTARNAHAKGDLGSSVTCTPEVEEALHQEATLEEINEMKDLIEAGMQQGALAEGMGINYTPGASRWEIVEMFLIAAKYAAHSPRYWR